MESRTSRPTALARRRVCLARLFGASGIGGPVASLKFAHRSALGVPPAGELLPQVAAPRPRDPLAILAPRVDVEPLRFEPQLRDADRVLIRPLRNGATQSFHDVSVREDTAGSASTASCTSRACPYPRTSKPATIKHGSLRWASSVTAHRHTPTNGCPSAVAGRGSPRTTVTTEQNRACR